MTKTGHVSIAYATATTTTTTTKKTIDAVSSDGLYFVRDAVAATLMNDGVSVGPMRTVSLENMICSVLARLTTPLLATFIVSVSLPVT